jgi:hypothetical protein
MPKYPVIKLLTVREMIIENDLTAIPGCLNAETDTQTVICVYPLQYIPEIKL